MKHSELQGWLLLALLAPLLGLGCGGGRNGDREATYPVSGTISLGGQPVEGATVNFRSADGQRSAVGRTDAAGRYRLTTFNPGDGALPGNYQVAVTKYQAPGGESGDDSGAGYNPDAPEVLPQNVLPNRYADPQGSGLTATVTEGNNTFDFALQP